MPKAAKRIFDDKKKLVNHLNRYYTGKGYSVEINKNNFNAIDCSCSEFDLVIDNFEYFVYVTEPCKRKFFDKDENVKFWAEMSESLYNKIGELIPIIEQSSSYSHTKSMLTEEFLHELVTRKEIITEVLADIED